MAAGERYQLIDRQVYAGQECLNVYYYQQLVGEGVGADELIDAFVGSVIPLIINLQVNTLEHTEIAVINIDNDADYATRGLTEDNFGTLTGDGMPPYAAWAFRYNRTTRAVRNGQKRIGGVDEASQVEGVAISATIIDLNLAAAAMGDTIEGDPGFTFIPRIFHKAVGDPTPPLSDGTAYPVGSVSYVSLSTQNTRKFGRGI